MSSERRLACLTEPRLRAFLPMLYVAWADGDLNDQEIVATRTRLRAMTGLDEACRDALGHWLDPEAPPSPSEMSALLSVLREATAELETADRLTLVEVGLELAAGSDSDSRPGDVELEALAELVEALGLTGTDAARQLLEAERPAVIDEPSSVPSFSPSELTAVLEEPHAEQRRLVKRILERPQFAPRYGESTETRRERVLSLCRELADEGLGALSFPEEWGGQDSPGRFVATFETLAYGDLSLLVKFGVQFGLFGGAVALLGSERHHRRYLRDIGTLSLPGCFAMTETGHGSNVRDLETTATFDAERDEFVIRTPSETARKDYIGNAALHGRLAVVFAQLAVDGDQHGVHGFLVPIRADDGTPVPGVRVEDCGEKLGLNGVDNGRLWFDGSRIPRENLLNRFAEVSPDGTYESLIPSPAKRFFTTIGTLVGGRVSVALAALSVSKTALTIAVRYGARRRQFGPAGKLETPLLDYPSHQLRLFPRLAATYALHFALRELGEEYADSQGGTHRELETMAAGVKAWATRFATGTVQECREACGGQGYLAVNRFAALKADSDVFTTFEGDNVVLLQLVAKSLLTGLRRQFQDMGLIGLVRHLAGEAATAVAELNPIVTRRTDVDHLRDPDFHRAAFGWREQHLLATAARRIRARLGDGVEAHDAFIDCQDHLIELGRAHVERLMFESFHRAIEAQPGDALGPILEQLCALFALSRLEADRGWLQEHGYLEAAKSKAVRAQVRRLCREIRPEVEALVQAFDIPDALISAPIAVEA